MSVGDRALLEHIKVSKNVTVVKVARTCYFIHNFQKSMFPDRYTLNAMGYEYGKLNFVGRDFIAAVPDANPPLQTLWDHHQNEAFLSLGTSLFIKNTSKIFPLLNPSYVYWNGDIVVSWRTESEAFRLVYMKRNSETLLNSSVKIAADIKHMKKFSFTDSTVNHLSMKGEDPRLVVTRDSLRPSVERLWVVFCKRYHRSRPELQMSYAEVILKEGKLMTETVLDINFNNERLREDQKNWSPFATNGTELLFIAGIDPHRIVTTSPVAGQPTKVMGHTLALTQPFLAYTKFWKYGELRGGTPAVLIGSTNDRYLSFFHSSNHPPEAGNNVLKTYAMGAYTFCAAAPHKVMSMSRTPFVHESMYSGPWSHLPESYYHIDYIVFPMSFVLSPAGPDGSDAERVLYLTYGRQDNEGWVATIDYQLLLASLAVVSDKC
jgi:hypothetical protein